RAWWANVRRVFGCGVIGRRGGVQKLAGTGDVGLACAASEQAIVPNAMEAARQNMQQEAADELVGGDGHELLPVGAGAAVILVSEGDAGLVEGNKAAVRDRYAVSVAREIGENGFRAGEGRFGINNPTLPSDRRKV